MWVATLPFADGERDVPQWQADLFREYKIPTWDLSYQQAVDRLNWHNTKSIINAHADKLIAEHFREHGQ